MLVVPQEKTFESTDFEKHSKPMVFDECIPNSGDSCSSEETTEGELDVSSKNLGSKEKKVSFVEEAKNWDGLRPIHTDFDELLYCFLVKGQSIGDVDILKWTAADCSRIFNLCYLLRDLVIRLKSGVGEEEETKQVPCLPQGGGRSMRVETAYEPYLVSLLSVLATALSLALKSPRKMNAESIQSTEEQKLLEYLIENKADLKKLAAPY